MTTTINVVLSTKELDNLRSSKYSDILEEAEYKKTILNPTMHKYITGLRLQYITDKTILALEGATADSIATFLHQQLEIDTSIAVLSHLLELHNATLTTLKTTTNSTNVQENTHE